MFSVLRFIFAPCGVFLCPERFPALIVFNSFLGERGIAQGQNATLNALAVGTLAVLSLFLLSRRIRQKRAHSSLEERLRTTAEVMAATTGEAYFRSLAQHLSVELRADCAFVAELTGDRRERIRTLATYADGQFIGNTENDIANTPCERVVATGGHTCRRNIQSLFPKAEVYRQLGIHSYSGIALKDSEGRPIGLIGVLSRSPIDDVRATEAMLQYFASRSSAEVLRRHAEEALRESEAKNKAILKALPDLMFIMDRDGTYLDCYAKNPRDLLVPPEQLLGKNMREILPPEVSDAVAEKLQEAASTGEPATVEYSLVLPDRTGIFEARIVLCGENKFLSIIRDITETRRTNIELKKTHQFIERITDTLPSILFIYDLVKRCHVYMNQGVTAILGYSEAEIREMGSGIVPTLVHPHDRHRFDAHSSRLGSITDGQVLRVVYRVRHKDGKWRWFHGSETVFARGEDGQVTQTIGTATDVTEHQRTQEELQLLSSRLLSLQDEERRKLAAELHEVTAQNVFAVTLNLKVLRELKGHSQSTGEARSRFDGLLTECESLCQKSLREIRESSYSLHPPALHHLGLVSTLRWYVDGFAKRSGIQVRLVVAEDIARLPLEMETDLFRVVQEGLANVARHSGSGTAVLRLERRSDEIVLQIKDSGHGFPASEFGRSESWTGLGIPEMRQRLRQFGGSLEINSTSEGTLLVARVPLDTTHAVEVTGGNF